MAFNKKVHEWQIIKLLSYPTYLAILAKGEGPGVHVEGAGDDIALCEGGQGPRLLPAVVQVPTVRPVQPHVTRRPVPIVRHWQTTHTHTCTLVTLIFLSYLEL